MKPSAFEAPWITRKEYHRGKKRNNGSTPHTSLHMSVPSIVGLQVPASPDLIWYSLTLSSKGEIQADTLESPGIETQLAMYDSAGNLIKDIYYGGSATISRIFRQGLEPGTYLFAVGVYPNPDGINFANNFSSSFTTTNTGNWMNGIRLSLSAKLYPQPPIAKPTPIFELYNTGQGLYEGHVHGNGTPDSHYTVGFPGIYRPAVVTVLEGFQNQMRWMDNPNTSESAWIGLGYVSTGAHNVTTTFDLSGYSEQSVSITLEIMADRTLDSVYLNGTGPLYTDGTDTGITIFAPAHTEWHPFTINYASGLQYGLNTLTFVWSNQDNQAGSGIRVRVTDASGIES